jgi:hypothetical protein
MSTILSAYLATEALAPPLSGAEADILAEMLSQLSNIQVYPSSITAARRSVLFLGRYGDEKRLGALVTEASAAHGLTGQTSAVEVDSQKLTLIIAPFSAANAAALRLYLPFLVPQPLGLRKSAGCGDRLGLATPGHIRAIRNSTLAPIFAQQSMRENARTGRTPQAVVDEAMWGVLQEGWRQGYGADADHLKTTADIDLCAAAGYTFYTIDPGDFVDDRANNASPAALEQMVEALPWSVLDSDLGDLESRLADKVIALNGFELELSREDLLRAAAKYGQAVAHTVSMYRHLVQVMGSRPFELEMSVDETETITTLAEHVYIVNELKRLNVEWVSLAPRYVGTFEKGVDYIGDPGTFEESFAQHVAVARTFGPYKLSLHSGSDKFRVYPIASRLAGELVHLKTAGTSYLEALRAIAILNPGLFRDIVAFALDRYPTDRATYHVSAELARVPDAAVMPDDQLATLLDDFHGREVLHVTFGSVLNDEALRDPFFATLRANEDVYAQIIETHFEKHFSPFD